MSVLGSVGNVLGGAINGVTGGGANAGGAGAAGGGDSASNFQAQISELKRVSEEAQAKSMQMRMVSTQLSSDKKVADERVQ